MKKRLLGVGLSILLAAGLAGCQTEGKKETQSAPAETASETAGAESAAEKTEEAAKTVDPKSVKLAYVSMNLANPWNATVKKGFEAACEELGCEYISIDSEYKVDKQVASLESLVNDKYSGFVFTPIDPNATWDIVEQAKAQGVATATIAQQQDNVNLIYGMKEYDYGHTIGTQAGQWIKDNLGGKAKVAIISQDNVESVIARGDGVEDALKEICPDVEIVARQAGDTLEGGMKIVESVL
ncbi:sugar ABC transporter substrate-binding protein, partial [Salmonella enterica subsp. enterica serovar Infantis]|nr:sugar ABC transporter substrate-binding protein [Salmonella enterica subsp. enterica serovar Infantis]